jgi:hypothetical protein
MMLVGNSSVNLSSMAELFLHRWSLCVFCIQVLQRPFCKLFDLIVVVTFVPKFGCCLALSILIGFQDKVYSLGCRVGIIAAIKPSIQSVELIPSANLVR